MPIYSPIDQPSDSTLINIPTSGYVKDPKTGVIRYVNSGPGTSGGIPVGIGSGPSPTFPAGTGNPATTVPAGTGPGTLPSTPIAGPGSQFPIGELPAGGTGIGGGGAGAPWYQSPLLKAGAKNVFPLLGALFGGDDDASARSRAAIAEAQQSQRNLTKAGAGVQAQGASALNPVLSYLNALNSGDPQALLMATMPERRRVIDQYDTAKQAAQFGPQGGGTASATTNLNTREASDLAMIGAQARPQAMGEAAKIGTALTGQGLQTQQAANLTSILTPLLAQSAHDEESQKSLWGALANLGVGLLDAL